MKSFGYIKRIQTIPLVRWHTVQDLKRIWRAPLEEWILFRLVRGRPNKKFNRRRRRDGATKTFICSPRMSLRHAKHAKSPKRSFRSDFKLQSNIANSTPVYFALRWDDSNPSLKIERPRRCRETLLPERQFKRCIQLLSQLTLLHSFRIRRFPLLCIRNFSATYKTNSLMKVDAS